MSHPVLAFWGTKGGVGTSTVAAATAIRMAAQEGKNVTLIDTQGDLRHLLGVVSGGPHDDDVQDPLPLAPCLSYSDAGCRSARCVSLDDAVREAARSGPVVIDAGSGKCVDLEVLALATDVSAVTRNCYMALATVQAEAEALGGHARRIVLVEEPGRALRQRDVSCALGADTVTVVAWDPRVSRAIDAGTIVSMLPAPLRRFDLPAAAEEASSAGWSGGYGSGSDVEDVGMDSHGAPASRSVCGHVGVRSEKPCILPEGHAATHRYN